MKSLINHVVRVETEFDAMIGVLAYNAELGLYIAGGWAFRAEDVDEINGVFVYLI